MASIYTCKGHLFPIEAEPLTVSIGTRENPQTVFFKTEGDMIAYLHGHQKLNDQRIMDNYKRIETAIHNAEPNHAIAPEWTDKYRLIWRKFLAGMFGERGCDA